MTQPGDDAKFALEVGSSSVKIGATGGGAARLSEALADLISPFSNSVGFLGDRIGDVRRAAAFRAAKKGIDMLAQEGIEAGDIPPKILLPWLEGASLETEQADKTLEDAWAGLFARSVKSSDAAIVSYIDVLKRIGAEEAGLLDFFATDTSPGFSAAFYDPKFNRGLAGDYLDLDGLLKKFDETADAAEFRERMEKFGLQSMCQVIYYSLNQSRTFTTKYFDEHEQAISNLEHLGLIEVSQITFERNRTYTIHWFQITKFAFDMLWACRGQITGARNLKSATVSVAGSADEMKRNQNAVD